MRIIRPPRTVWCAEAECTACGALLLVEERDVYHNTEASDSIYHMDDEPVVTTVFQCPFCGHENIVDCDSTVEVFESHEARFMASKRQTLIPGDEENSEFRRSSRAEQTS